MFKTDWLSFQRILNRVKKEHFEESRFYYKENENNFELFISEGEFQFKTVIPKDEFIVDFKEKYLSQAISVEEDRIELKPDEIGRQGISRELETIDFYRRMADSASNENVRNIVLNIAKEEKTHVGEFQALLLEEDKQQKAELIAGKKEVEG